MKRIILFSIMIVLMVTVSQVKAQESGVTAQEQDESRLKI